MAYEMQKEMDGNRGEEQNESNTKMLYEQRIVLAEV